MRLTAELNQETHEIECDRNDGRLVAKIDGRQYDLSVREVEKGFYLLVQDGEVFECLVESDASRRGFFAVHIKNRTFSTTISDPRRLSSVDASSALSGDGAAQIASPMAGKVVRVLVKQGAAVKTGEGIVVVEAMKMQNELKSPRDGVVGEVRAVDNATVNAGDVLAIIESAKD
jgi:biotin carboxyl carrier protein